MTLEAYAEVLRQQDRDCRCPELGLLFETKHEVDKLVGLCDNYYNNVDLDDVSDNDIEFLNACDRAHDRLHSAEEKYSGIANQLLEQGHLKPRLHDQNGAKPGYAALSEVERWMNEEKGVVTIHCASCDQQVLVLEPYEYA